MDPERLDELFYNAAPLDEAARREFIERETEPEGELRSELESLLRAHDSAGDFLETPAVAEAVELVPAILGSNLIGSHIGSWRVDSLIHGGGMGSVFRATRIEDDFTQSGALKLVRVGFETPELLARFAQERRLLASIEHPNIARLLDGGTTGEGLPWLAMEYVEGVPIDLYCDHHRLNLETRLGLFEQLADAIAYLHENLITHRDIKASNVLVDVSGRVRVLDFGIAALLDEAEGSREATAERRLSLASAAPEQLRGEAISTATDVYALGVLLYRLLCGVEPHRITSAMTAAEIEAAICDTDPPSPSNALRKASDGAMLATKRGTSVRRLLRELTGDLDTITAKAKHKDPMRRYRSVADLRADLQRWREDRPVLARPDSTAYRSGKFVRRHWLGLSATAAVIFALAAGLSAALWQADEARRQRDRAQTMNSFMQEVLAEADPYEADSDRTVREALAEASELLGRRFPEQPLLEAGLRQSVASVQVTLLDFERGEVNLNRALELFRSNVPADDEMLLLTESHLAWVANEREDYDASIVGYLSILARLDDSHSAELRANVHNDLGVVLNNVDRFEEALSHLESAMRLAPDARDRVATLVNLGYSADGLGQLEAAKDYYLKAIEQLRAEGEAGVVADLAHALSNYGNVLSQQGRDNEALPYYLESLAVRRRVFGEESSSVSVQSLNVGRLLLDMGRNDDALVHLQRALELLPRYRAEDSIYRLLARSSHARALLLTQADPGQRAEAIATLQSVLKTMRDDETPRASRFADQTAQWLDEAQRDPSGTQIHAR